jgi:hypothetical protein
MAPWGFDEEVLEKGEALKERIYPTDRIVSSSATLETEKDADSST